MCIYLVFAHPFYTRGENWIFLAYEIVIFLFLFCYLNYYIYKETKASNTAGDRAWKCHFKWLWIWIAIFSVIFWLLLRNFQTYKKRDTPYVVKKIKPIVTTEASDVIYDRPRRAPTYAEPERRYRREYLSPQTRGRDADIVELENPVKNNHENWWNNRNFRSTTGRPNTLRY